MAGPCPTPGTGTGFLSTTLAHLDCQAQTIGAAGYQALASSGSPVFSALTTLLTIFVAIQGIRMLSGRVPSIAELTLSALKVGLVLLLATSWPAYRIIAYDLVLRGPAELFGQVGSASALPGSAGGLVDRLQAVDDGILSLVAAGSGRLDIASRANTAQGLAAGPPAVSDDMAFGLARTAYVGGIIGATGLLRILGGLLLAMGPFFAGCLLFSATRSFFAGWVRSLVATGLGSLATSLALSIELTIVEPWLSNILALRAERIATPYAPFELMAIAIAFTVILFGALAACARLSFASGFEPWARDRAANWFPQDLHDIAMPNSNRSPRQNEIEAPSRAHLVAQSVTSVDERRRGNVADRVATSGKSQQTERTIEQIRSGDAPTAPFPLGQTYQRTSRRVPKWATKRSASA
jgi:type IV secretion system protein VirB6